MIVDHITRQRRARWRAAFWGVVVFCVIALLVTVPAFRPLNLYTFVHVSAVVAISSLAGFWLGLGKSIWRIPLGFVIALLTGTIFGLAESGPRSEILYYLLFAGGITAAVGSTAYLLRIYFGQFVQIENMQSSREALQFGVRHILLWTTIIAVAVALMKAIGAAEIDFNFDAGILVVSLAMSFSAIAVLEIWALLGARITITRLTVLLVALPLVAFVNVWITGKFTVWATTTVLSQLPIILAIYCLRKQDYRFAKT